MSAYFFPGPDQLNCSEFLFSHPILDSEANSQNVERSTGVAWSTSHHHHSHSNSYSHSHSHSNSHSQSISSIMKQAELYVPSLESFTTDGKGEFGCGPIFALFFCFFFLLFLSLERASGRAALLSGSPAPLCVCVCVCVPIFIPHNKNAHTHVCIGILYSYMHTHTCILTNSCICKCARAAATVACVCLSTPARAEGREWESAESRAEQSSRVKLFVGCRSWRQLAASGRHFLY